MFKATINNNSSIEISGSAEKRLMDQQEFIWDVLKVDDNYFHIIKDNVSYKAEVVKADVKNKTFIVKINGIVYEVKLKDKFDLLLEKMGFNNSISTEVKEVKAPMPGLILDVKVTEGSKVHKGDPLLILEAMKMENILKSPGEGIVKSINVKKGENVEKNQILIHF